MRWIVFMCAVTMAFFLKAQEADTVYLSEIEIFSSLEKYTQGMQVSRADSAQLNQHEGNSLGELLQKTTPVYIRSYGGEGQLSTVSFRGTTPNHTRVNWNGVDINSQSLGQTDFSSIPVFLFSDIELYHGASSVLFGSGAMGSTLNIKSNLLRKKGLNIAASQQFGSFGKRFSGLKAAYGRNKWSVYLGGLSNQIENDFEVKYRNTTYKQNNAASALFAVAGGARYNLTPTSNLSFEAWYNHHDRESQPVIGHLNASDELLDKNFRLNLDYQNALNAGFVKTSINYADDRQTYNESSHTNLKRYRWSTEYEYTGSSFWDFRAGGNISVAFPDVSTYEKDTSQLRGGVFVMNQYQPDFPLVISINVRKPFLEGISSPWVPSLGAEYQLFDSEQSRFSLLVQGARGFRFPTLNDLFWQPGGNPDLKPEDGFSTELGLKYDYKNDFFSLITNTTFYRSWIKDMIIWIPNGAFSYPENVREVEIAGFETLLSFKGKFSKGSWYANINYTYNQSQNVMPLNSQDRSEGKQLAYVPFHKGSGLLGLKYKRWSLSWSQAFTGKRFTESTNTSVLEPFTVADMLVSKSFKMKEHRFSVAFKINNVWDEAYQNYELRATPGRNYLIRLNYLLTKLKQ